MCKAGKLNFCIAPYLQTFAPGAAFWKFELVKFKTNKIVVVLIDEQKLPLKFANCSTHLCISLQIWECKKSQKLQKQLWH